MARLSAENLLVNALVNTEDVLAADVAGITPEMMLGFQTEYRWLINFYNLYGRAPTAESIKHKFPGFQLTDSRDVPYLCEEVRRNYTKQQLIRTVKAASFAIQEGDLDEAIMSLGTFQVPELAQPMTNVLHDEAFFGDYDKKVDSIRLPWATLDTITGGMREGDLWYWAARLGQGKSWTIAEIVVGALLQGRDVCYYSLEMPKAQVQVRMHVALGAALDFDVDHVAMRDRVMDISQYRKIVNGIREMVPGKLFIKDTSDGRVTPLTVAGNAQQAELHVVDYAGLMSSPGGNRAVDDWRHMASISNQLKEVANGKGTRILAAAQINRDGDTKSKHPPKIKNLAQSDALGQDGDVVITHKRYAKTAMVYNIEKNRSGEANVEFWTKFEPNTGTFTEIKQHQADERRENEDWDAD